jgi:hypothetical protein
MSKFNLIFNSVESYVQNRIKQLANDLNWSNDELSKIMEKNNMRRLETETQNGIKQRKKQIKNPDGPKRNISAYILFSRDMRKIIRDRNTDNINSKEMMKHLSNEWKSADSKTKQKYTKLAELDKKRYNNELNNAKLLVDI